MKWKNTEIPDPPTSVGKKSKPRDTPSGTDLRSKIIDEVGIVCDYEDEIYYKIFQVLKYVDNDEYAFRISYWRYKEERKNWFWAGQNALMISPEEWEKLYKKAKEKGFFEKFKNKKMENGVKMSEEFPGIRDPPKKLKFKYPEGGKANAEVVKEIRKKKLGTVSGEYCFVIQLVKYPGSEDRVRFGYYRKKAGDTKYRWASQTTYQAPVSFTKELIRMAEREGIL